MRRRLLVLAACCGLAIPSFSHAAPFDPAQTSKEQRTHLIARYQEAVAVDPDYLPLHYFLGVSLMIDGQDSLALSELARAYPAYPDSVEMHYNLGLACSRLGDLDSALLYFERAEELGALNQPELYPLANAYFNLGLAYQEEGSIEDADHLFSRVLALDPQRHEIYRIRGDLLARRGNVEGALAEFGAYLKVHPDDPTIREYVFSLHYNRALQSLEREQGDAARVDLEQALSAAPDNPLALYYLGYLDYADGNFETAVERLTAAVPNTPESLAESIGGILHNCAVALLEQRKSSQALVALQPLLSRPIPPVKALFMAGNIRLSLKEYTLARQYYRQLLQIDPAHPGAVVNLVAAEAGSLEELLEEGRRLQQKGELQPALEKLEEALGINPADARARNHARDVRAAIENQAFSCFSAAEEAMRSDQLLPALDQVRRGLALLPSSERGVALQAQIESLLADEAENSIAVGKRALESGNLIEAEKAFDHVLAIRTGDTEAMNGKAQVAARRAGLAAAAIEKGYGALGEGRIAEARAAFVEALRQHPENSEAMDGLAKLEAQLDTAIASEIREGRRSMEAGRFPEARRHFARALDLRDDAMTRTELVELDRIVARQRDLLLTAARDASSGRDFKRARTLFSQILGLIPADKEAVRGEEELEAVIAAEIHRDLTTAEKHLSAGNLKGALDRYRQVLDLDPANPEGLRGLEAGRQRQKEKLAQLSARGAKLLDKGDLSGAEAAFRQALEFDPYQRDALAGVRRIAQLKAVGIRPGDEQQLYLQGIEQYTHGHYDQAVAAWEQVLILAPGHEKARMNIEKARRKLRRIEEYRGG